MTKPSDRHSIECRLTASIAQLSLNIFVCVDFLLTQFWQQLLGPLALFLVPFTVGFNSHEKCV